MENGSNGSALAVVEPSTPVVVEPRSNGVSESHRRATDAAGALKAMVLSQAMSIQGKRYIPVVCYQAIANAMGCVATAHDVKREETGFTAQGQVKRLADGAILSEGEGFVGDDEPKWAKGPEYARRSMAQTRAIGRACRAAFAFVVPMIDAGLSTTPYEEMDGVAQSGSIDPPAPVVRGNAAIRNALRPSPPAANQPPPHTDADFRPSASPPATNEVRATRQTAEATHDRNMSFGFGKSKGVALGDLDESSLKFYADCANRDLADMSPAKAKWHEKTRAQLANIVAEMKWRGLA